MKIVLLDGLRGAYLERLKEKVKLESVGKIKF